MAFGGGGFSSLGNAMGAASEGVSQGPDLEAIETERLGFLAVQGDAKVRLTSPWSSPPPPTASLMSIASKRGLVAAAGPHTVVIARTEAVRKAFENGPEGEDTEVRRFDPQVQLPMPSRVSQLAFTADENYLILSAEQGGGLAVYKVDAIEQGSKNPDFQIATDGQAVRAIIPNPSPDMANLCAVVTEPGNLLMANIKDQNFLQGQNGVVLKDQVTCATWSSRGKQIVAGLSDGNIHQLTPEGILKAEVARPPQLSSSYFVSSISWLENHLFLAFHVSAADEYQEACHLISRQGAALTFQSLPNNPLQPFGSPEKPPHHSILRLRDFPPNLQDLLILNSTAAPDIALLSRSKVSLKSDSAGDPTQHSNVFTLTDFADDARRAQMPAGSDGFGEPPAIGFGLDLSSTEKVRKPIPTDEMDESPGPLPALWALNSEGVLAAWWIVYSDSIRSGETYPGMTTTKGAVSAPAASAVAQPAQPAQPSAFGGSAFGNSTAPAPAFGGPSALGGKPSPWGSQPAPAANGSGAANPFAGAATSTPAFGKPSFGVPSGPGAFGQSGGLGAKPSPWASNNSTSSPFASSNTPSSGSVFGSNNNNTGTAGGFAGFAKSTGFGGLGANADGGGTSIFASKKSNAPEVSMGSETSNTAFPPSSSKPATSGANPFGSQPFKLQSSFQPDPNAKDDGPAEKPQSLFGSNFKSALGETTTPAKENPFGSATTQPAKENPFGSATTQPAKENPFGGVSTTPAKENPFGGVTTTPAKENPFGSASNANKSIFGQPKDSAEVESTTPTTTPAPSRFFSQAPASPQPGGGLFGSKPTPSTSGGLFGSGNLFKASTGQTPTIKREAESPFGLNKVPDAPLPPESTSKVSYPLGESSSSSATSTDTSEPSTANASRPKDAPLPPDSPPSNKAPAVTSKTVDAPLPPDPVRNKKVYDVELPPLPGTTKPKPVDDAPLPPDPKRQPKAYDVKFPSVPGVKPSNKPSNNTVLPTSSVGPGFLFPTNPPPVASDSDSDEAPSATDEGEGEEDDAASEGSGVDVAKDLSPSVTGANDKTPGYTPQSSFDGLGGSGFSAISRPEPARSYFGEIGRNAPVLPQPLPVSPRSPSPIRNVPGRMLGGEQTRSVSSPVMASRLLEAKRAPARMENSIIGKAAPSEDQIMEHQRKWKAKREAEESQLLIDEEDATIQELLTSEPEPTVVLDEFVAHSGVAPPASDLIPAQVEAVYRDINSMVDTLGLNARSLRGYISGHIAFKHGDRDRHDLSSPDDWTLDDIGSLSTVIDAQLGKALEQGRVVDIENKIRQALELQRELARARNKQSDLKRVIASLVDPDQAAANRSLPLSAEQAAQQNDLRREYAKFSKHLAEVEESLTLLKAKLVSATSAGGKGGPTPTIEAVVRTITKMTSMVEKRSGDIDVLENQLRKLRLSSAGPASREGSPFTTPNAKRTSMSSSLMFSPERSSYRESIGTPQRSVMRHSHSLSGSISGLGGSMFRTPPRKKLSGFGDVEKQTVKDKRERRGAVLGKLRASVAKKEVSVVPIDQGA